MASDNQTASFLEGEQKTAAPSISLPKGGGALRGIGEKFAANPVTGTGSMTIPLATSPSRSGFGPQISISYDSGSGNGSFGFGWSLNLPQITRKTDKGIPQYLDNVESDVFILSGTEDLVPVIKQDAAGNFQVGVDGKCIIDDHVLSGYTVRPYRPRIEGLFSRIERWTNCIDPTDVHWRSFSKDNLLTIYGNNVNSRIFDPTDRRRIFTWLISETRDDRGNAIVYEYKAEDGAGIDLNRAHERNRGEPQDTRRTSNRYLKRISYGNRTPIFDSSGNRPPLLTPTQVIDAKWMFEVVFDYGDHAQVIPKSRDDEEADDSGKLKRPWAYRKDPFSSYRAGFEIRTTRLCRRVLMFHHFPDEADIGNDCLVRSTDFIFSHDQEPANSYNHIYTFLNTVTQFGYCRTIDGYLKRSFPPVEFEYSQPVVQDTIEEIPSSSLENLPIGVDGAAYQWVDLHGEGIPGILTEQGTAWFYKRNLSPKGDGAVKLAPLELVSTLPNLSLAGGQAQIMDLASDGQPDLVVLDGPMPGLFEHDNQEGWQPFRSFISRLNRNTRDPNLRFIDLDGDGHADVLITEEEALVWHPSLEEDGFGPPHRIHQALDEEKGPRLIFADGTQSIYLADLSGDGLTDLVRIRNGEICYWPNLGYGRFGAKVTMDDAPHFDNPDQFNQKRILLADIDGSGTTDLIYLHRDGVRIYFNQSGNSWSNPQFLNILPHVDDLTSIVSTDLLGNGTACLVWSSPLPADALRPMRYVNLMGSQKPHLLIKTSNNLGAETRVHYAISTKFYLQDRHDGKPWITRLPFPVHVIESVETYDHISRNHFVTRYAYHHGHFDSVEREFRGFGMVEQWDTEEFAAHTAIGQAPIGINNEAASHVPPVLTKTWFHTGAYLDREQISHQFEKEYYCTPGSIGLNTSALLDDTCLPDSLTLNEEREACRALKGSMLHQEVFALDGTDRQSHPYTVTEQNFTVRLLQPQNGNRHSVLFTHPREAISYQYERNPADPRIGHALTLKVDDFGNVLQSVQIGYGRRPSSTTLPLQAKLLATFTETFVTNSISADHEYRNPLPYETRTSELSGLTLPATAAKFTFDKVVAAVTTATSLDYEKDQTEGVLQKRLIEHGRAYYRRNDLKGPLPLGKLESLALPWENYKLAFTPELILKVFGNRTSVDMFAVKGGYVHNDGDPNWWIPSGKTFYSPNPSDTPLQERSFAQKHFFMPRRFRDPFHTDALSTESIVEYDTYDLLMVETRDPLGNCMTVGEREKILPDSSLLPAKSGNNYRVLQPALVMDPNRNRTQFAFDALGMVVGTAVMGKPEETLGDSLDGFTADLTETEIFDHIANPLADPHAILGRATTRLVYDLFAYQRTKDQPYPQPAVVYTLAREKHDSDLSSGEKTKIQHSFSYSDGFGREIQKKIQAESGQVPLRDTAGKIIIGENGQPEMSPNEVTPRWVGSGWTVFNNKRKPVRQFEPFFTDTHCFEFDIRIGVSPVLFYDPIERVVATLHPNHTYEKVVFDPWQQITWDVNDTILDDPRTDADVKGYTAGYFASLPASPPPLWQTWYYQRQGGALGLQEKVAAIKAKAHAGTPTTAYFDTLGRPFLTQADNGPNPTQPGTQLLLATQVSLDIEGNQREVVDALGRVVMRYLYSIAGPEKEKKEEKNSAPNRIYQVSMEAGERWILNDVTSKPIFTWDSRNHQFRTEYDALRRPTNAYFKEGSDDEILVSRNIYGEDCTDSEASNLRGKVFKLFDQAGVVTSVKYDFKGNLLRSQRQLAKEYKTILDWSGETALEAEIFTSRTLYDALNRLTQLIAPYSDQFGTKLSVMQPVYNEANLMEQDHAWLNEVAEPTGLLDPTKANLHSVTNIDYDAKGQRTLIEYGNGASTSYEYDPLTFRLTHLLTQRKAVDFPDDCLEPPPDGWPGSQLQNLHYTYDPAGNITHIRDDAQQTIYFKNQRVEPSADYTYDALYRLIEATGREHLGQIDHAPIPHSHNDAGRVSVPHPGDGTAMGVYTERYVYDEVGNLTEMKHIGSDPVHSGWTRSYTYNETSLIEDGTGIKLLKQNNRLSSTTVGNGDPVTEHYLYDEHGNMLRLGHLGGADSEPNLHWDYRDQLHQTDLGGGGTAYYVYDASGQRVRKVWEKSVNLIEERIYLGGFEIFRKHDISGAITLERETLHIMDDKQRIVLVETRTIDTADDDPAPPQLIRFQFSNHLGSASLELDYQAQIISYEEYTPYGSTSYQAVRSQTETPKRYRYTGMERDEETGLAYHGARYYASWLGRWTSCDPIGIGDGVNVYRYVKNNPITIIDQNGNKLVITTDAQTKTDVLSLVPEDARKYIYISPTGKVSVEIPEDENSILETDGYIGLKLLYNITKAKEIYYYQAIKPRCYASDDNPLNHMKGESVTQRYPINYGQYLQQKPKISPKLYKKYDAVLRIDPNVDFTISGKPIDRRLVVFHELWELYEMTTNRVFYNIPKYDETKTKQMPGDIVSEGSLYTHKTTDRAMVDKNQNPIWDPSKYLQSAHYLAKCAVSHFYIKDDKPGESGPVIEKKTTKKSVPMFQPSNTGLPY